MSVKMLLELYLYIINLNVCDCIVDFLSQIGAAVFGLRVMI